MSCMTFRCRNFFKILISLQKGREDQTVLLYVHVRSQSLGIYTSYLRQCKQCLDYVSERHNSLACSKIDIHVATYKPLPLHTHTLPQNNTVHIATYAHVLCTKSYKEPFDQSKGFVVG